MKISDSYHHGIMVDLNYLVPQMEPLRTYSFDPSDGSERFNGKLHTKQMPITNARLLHASPRLELEGFELLSHQSKVCDFWDEAELRELHYKEMEQLVCKRLNARVVIVFDHTLRRRAQHKPPLDGMGGSFAVVREPVGRVHADYTPRSAPERLKSILSNRNDLKVEDVKKYAIVGAWRPLNDGPLFDSPLAIADARSLKSGDFVPNDLIYPDRRGQTYAVSHNDSHQWFYYPGQTKEEVLLFRHFDLEAGASIGTTGAAAHTAVEEPTRPNFAEARQSLELRILVIS